MGKIILKKGVLMFQKRVNNNIIKDVSKDPERDKLLKT